MNWVYSFLVKCFFVVSFFNVNCVFAQLDTLHIAKKETTTLFSTIAGQAVKAKLTKKELIKETKIIVNDTIKISSYWFTCFSNGIQHQRIENGEMIYSDVIKEISKLPIGGKAYFTDILGYNIYNNTTYKIYDLEVEITD